MAGNFFIKTTNFLDDINRHKHSDFLISWATISFSVCSLLHVIRFNMLTTTQVRCLVHKKLSYSLYAYLFPLPQYFMINRSKSLRKSVNINVHFRL